MIPNLDLKQARAHWLSRQGLAEPLDAPLPDVLATTGWLRTLGGADIYRVPKPHATRFLRFSEDIWRPRASTDVEKAGAKWKDVDDAVKAVRSVIHAEGRTTDALRSFDEQGKKVGLSSSLPLALRVLAFRGESERTVEGGRLDSERYLNGAIRPPPYEPEVEACREALS